jgi:putative membrane protein
MINFYKKAFKKNEELDPMLYKEFLEKQLILRDYLAIERTILSNEATFLAYIRTSLTVAVVGITLYHLAPNSEKLQYFGIVISLFGVFLFLYGSVQSAKMKAKINEFLKRRKQNEKVVADKALSSTENLPGPQ